jgi:hypothetical protein
MFGVTLHIMSLNACHYNDGDDDEEDVKEYLLNSLKLLGSFKVLSYDLSAWDNGRLSPTDQCHALNKYCYVFPSNVTNNL